jgi:hypothetical protein
MKTITTWWNNQFDSKIETKMWFLTLAIALSLVTLLEVLNQLGVNTIIFH